MQMVACWLSGDREIGKEGPCTLWQSSGTYQKSTPFGWSLTFMCNIFLNVGQNSNDVADRIIMPQHKMFTCQLMSQSLSLAFRRDWDAAVFTIHRREFACVIAFLVWKGGSAERWLIQLDVVVKRTLGPAWEKFLWTLSWSGPYILRNTDIYQESPLIEGQYVHQRVLCFNFHIFSLHVVVHDMICLMISQLRICHQQRIVEGLNKPFPLAAFLA